MAQDIDIPPIYDPVTKEDFDHLSPIWMTYWSTFFETLSGYLSQFGMFVPHVTTLQRSKILNPQLGQFIFNTTLCKLQVYQCLVPSGAGWVTLETAPGNEFDWFVITTPAHNMSPHAGYIIDSAVPVVLTMPVTALIGETIKIIGINTGLYTIMLNAGQTIELGNMSTSVGPGLFFSSLMIGDSIELVCVQENTRWFAQSSVGNFNIT